MTTTPSNTPALPTPTDEEERASFVGMIVRFIRPAIGLTLMLALLTGILYPLAITGLAQLFFHSQANGSLVYRNGQLVASSLIGQYWTQPQYLHGRPSAAVNANGVPYDASNSGGTNLGPTNTTLVQTVQQRIAQLRKENPLTPATTPIPADLVEASASGLDPDVSVAGAYYQVPRIAQARGMTQDQVRAIIDANIQGRFLGLFGEPVVNVLDVNLALDQAQGK
jgi:K+-transporting ATPase ATPase C chain